MSKSFVRSLKNLSHSAAEIKVRNATSNDPFGPKGRELNELARLTYNYENLRDITAILQKRLSDKSKNWRHVLKSLTVVQYLLQSGSEDFMGWLTANRLLIDDLKHFKMYDEKGNENGDTIRLKAKSILKILLNKRELDKLRLNFHKLRLEMSKPGLGKSELDDDFFNVYTQADMFSTHVKTSESLDFSGARFVGDKDRKSLSLENQKIISQPRNTNFQTESSQKVDSPDETAIIPFSNLTNQSRSSRIHATDTSTIGRSVMLNSRLRSQPQFIK